MIDSLIRMLFLGIEIEIFFLLFILIRENWYVESKRRHRPPPDPPQQTERHQSTSDTPTSDAEQTEQLARSLAASPEPDPFQEADDTPESPDISQDIFQEDKCSVKYPDDAPRETTKFPIKKRLLCGIEDLNGVNAYSSQARLVEKEHGEILVLITENDFIFAKPSGYIAHEKSLNDVFRPFFEFEMPVQSDAKKFRITCERAAGLKKENRSFSLRFKGQLKVEAYYG